MRKNIKKVLSLLLTVGLSITISAITTVVKADTTQAPIPDVQYQAHVQNIGWQTPLKIGGQEAGTDGKGFRVEAIKISLENMPGYSVQYKAHVQNVGWQDWVSDGAEAGTDGRGLRVEAIIIKIVKTADGSTPTPVAFVTKGYVNNTYLNVRSAPSLDNSTPLNKYLYNFEKIEILDKIVDTPEKVVWDKIMYNNNVAYVSDAYI